jgi:hypothetical protein
LKGEGSNAIVAFRLTQQFNNLGKFPVFTHKRQHGIQNREERKGGQTTRGVRSFRSLGGSAGFRPLRGVRRLGRITWGILGTARNRRRSWLAAITAAMIDDARHPFIPARRPAKAGKGTGGLVLEDAAWNVLSSRSTGEETGGRVGEPSSSGAR